MTRPIGTVLAAIVLSGATLLSCSHKDIECPGSEMRGIDVRFDWTKAPEASPEGMTLMFYPLGSYEKVWRFDIAGAEGGAVEIPTGTYRMIAFNNDDGAVRISDTQSYENMTASARNIDEGVFSSTGMLYRAEVEYLEVTPCGVEYITAEGSRKDCRKSIVRALPDSVCTVYDTMTSETHDNSLYAPFGISVSDSLMNASADAFTPTSPGGRYMLTLVVTRTDGKSFSKSFDVTGQVVNSSSPRHVLIEIEGLEIPENDTPGSDVGDIDVIVDGWTTIEIDLEYNVTT